MKSILYYSNSDDPRLQAIRLQEIIICLEMAIIRTKAILYRLLENQMTALNQQNLVAGDSIFKRGDIFNGEVIVHSSGKNNKPIVYGAFGEGENPVIKGALDIKKWEISKFGIKTVKLGNKVYNLFVDNKRFS